MAQKEVQNSLALPSDGKRTFETLADGKKLESEVSRSITTDEKVLEKRRREYERICVRIDAIVDALQSKLHESKSPLQDPEVRRKNQDDIQRWVMLEMILSLSAMTKGLGLIIDCVSFRDDRETETGKSGKVRITIGSCLYNMESLVAQLYSEPDDNGNVVEGEEGALDTLSENQFRQMKYVTDRLDHVFFMLHRIGLSLKPDMYEGDVVESKTGTTQHLSDIFDANELEKLKTVKSTIQAKPKERKAKDGEVLTQEEIDAEEKLTQQQIQEDAKL